MTLAVPRLRTLHRGSRCVVNRLSPFLSEDIGSALKGGVKVCQRSLINEAPLPVTEYPLNLVREDATPLQCGFQSSPLSLFQAAKLIRHGTPPDNRGAPPTFGWSPVQRTGFKLMPASMVSISGSFWRMTQRHAGAWNRMRACALRSVRQAPSPAQAGLFL
jgi:hypothetical protein